MALPNIKFDPASTGIASQYTPPDAARSRQQQLSAARMGLDLNLYTQYALNPGKFQEQYGQYQNSNTGVFKIPDVTPGALISQGGPSKGPGGYTLAAGSTVDKPLNLADFGSTTFAAPAATTTPDAAKNFLPSYLQPGAPASGADITGGPGTTPAQSFVPQAGAPPVTPPGSPITPFVPQGTAGQPATGAPLSAAPRSGGTGGFAATSKLLELPFYLRQFGATNQRRKNSYG